ELPVLGHALPAFADRPCPRTWSYCMEIRRGASENSRTAFSFFLRTTKVFTRALSKRREDPRTPLRFVGQRSLSKIAVVGNTRSPTRSAPQSTPPRARYLRLHARSCDRAFQLAGFRGPRRCRVGPEVRGDTPNLMFLVKTSPRPFLAESRDL